MLVVPTDTAIEAATDTAVIVALSVALRLIPPAVAVVVKFPALTMDASMLLATWLRASATPIDSPKAVVPATATATEAAPAPA